MKMLFGVVTSILMLMTVGCINPSIRSLNIQRSGIRSVGDTATTVSLDAVDTATQATAIADETKKITIAIEAFLKDGKVADLTIPEITDKLRALVPEDYKFIYDMLVAQISSLNVPVEMIGTANIKRMRAMCQGIIEGCNEYDINDRPPSDKSLISNSVSASAIAEFGITMRRESAKRQR